MTIHNKHFYMRLNEWHHLYIGVLIVLLSYLFDLDAIYHIVGWLIFADDLIQHWMQGRYICWQMEQDDLNSGVLPHFFLHTLMYKYIRIQRFKIVNRITEFMNGAFK